MFIYLETSHLLELSEEVGKQSSELRMTGIAIAIHHISIHHTTNPTLIKGVLIISYCWGGLVENMCVVGCFGCT
jgi:hypothetical protein